MPEYQFATEVKRAADNWGVDIVVLYSGGWAFIVGALPIASNLRQTQEYFCN